MASGHRVELDLGREYAVFLGSLGPLGSHYRIWSPTDTGDTYPEGIGYDNRVGGLEPGGRDLFFQIGADPVPEPGIAVLLPFFLTVRALHRRRRTARPGFGTT